MNLRLFNFIKGIQSLKRKKKILLDINLLDANQQRSMFRRMRISLHSSSRNQDTPTFPLDSNRKIIEWMKRGRGTKKK